MTRGICRLCLSDADLQESHFMPAALYPKNKQVHFATQTNAGTDPVQLKHPLLCRACEQRFNNNGESEVLRWLAPKANTFPLHDTVKGKRAFETSDDLNAYRSGKVGIDADKFAYFALSIVWRAAVKQWLLPNDNTTSLIDIAKYAEPIRRISAGSGSISEERLCHPRAVHRRLFTRALDHTGNGG